MIITNSINDTRKQIAAARRAGKTIGFVPTMGALHEGHFSLVRAARQKSDFVVVSIFVNPTQFGPNEDLDKYPRTFEQDCQGCSLNGADMVFAPDSQVMYPEENLTWVNVENITDRLCGASRPGHFRGVTTVVTKLFNIVQPDIACFGQKDAQQVSVIETMVRQLNMPVTIIRCPIVREPDGLAMSSRNRYLDHQERHQALCLKLALDKAAGLFAAGCSDAATLITAMENIISQYPLARIDYIAIVDNQLLCPIEKINTQTLIALAVFIGKTRLIDNITLTPPYGPYAGRAEL